MSLWRGGPRGEARRRRIEHGAEPSHAGEVRGRPEVMAAPGAEGRSRANQKGSSVEQPEAGVGEEHSGAGGWAQDRPSWEERRRQE